MNKSLFRSISACALVLALTGCAAVNASSAATAASSASSSASASAPANGSASASQPTDSNALIGKVTAVDGNSITIAVGTMSGMQGGGIPGEKGTDSTSGATASAPADSSSPDSTTGATSKGTDGKGSGEKPSGDQQQRGGDGGSFTENGETQTIDISSATITAGGPDSSSSSSVTIAVDDIVMITLDSNGKATAVSVMSLTGGKMDGGSGQPGQPGGQNSSAPDSSADTDTKSA